jgi:tetratricopeptide (TPR) repeat protein
MKREMLYILGSLIGIILLVWFFEHSDLISISVIDGTRDALLGLLQIAGLCLFLLIIITIVRWLLRSPKGTAVLPFEIVIPEDRDKLLCYNGRTIADSLKAEMASIGNIHAQNPFVASDTRFGRPDSHQQETIGKFNKQQIQFKNEDLKADFADVAVVAVSGNNISIGKVMMTLKQMWNDRDPKYIISGSLQRYGNLIRLICNLRSSDGFNDICDVSKIIEDESEVNDLIKDLSFKVWQTIPKDWEISSTNSKTWLGLKYFTESLNSFSKYKSSNIPSHLDNAREACLRAEQEENGYLNLYPLAFAIGSEMYERQLYDKALELFECAGTIAYNAFPNSNDEIEIKTDAYNAFGWCHWNLKHYPQAEFSFQRVSELRPDRLEGYYNLSLVLMDVNREREARLIYDKVVDKGIIQGEKHLIRLGDWLDALGFGNEAIEKYMMFIEKDPSNAELLYKCGNIYMNLQDFDKAIEMFNRVLKIDPEFSDNLGNPHSKLGEIHFLNDRPDEAEKEFHLAIHQSPLLALPYFYLGHIYSIKEKEELAIKEFKRAIHLDEGIIEAYLCLGQLYEQKGLLEEAMKSFQTGIEKGGPNEQLHVNLARVLFELDRFEDSEKEYKTALKVNWDSHDTHLGLGYLYRVIEDYTNSILAFRNATRLDPQNAHAFRGLAETYRKLKMWEEAIDAYTDSIRIDNSDALTYVCLAHCHEQKGEKIEAEEAKRNAELLKEKWMGPDHYSFACYEALFGRNDLAVQHLRVAWKEGKRTESIKYASRDVDFDSIREDRAFKKLMEEHTLY